MNAAHADEVCEQAINDETDGLAGLPLAAIHIERAIRAMASISFGRWQVTIISGDADQHWCFKQVNPNRIDPLVTAIANYRDGMDQFNSATGINDETRDALVDTTYGPPMEVLDQWSRPAAQLSLSGAQLKRCA